MTGDVVDVDYTCDGPADAPALVLVHALGTSRALWAAQIPELAARFRVISFDLRGHGRSPVPPGPYTVADLGADVLRLFDRLGLERASLAGTSIGGTVGQWLGATAPDRLDRLALVCTSPRFGTPQMWRDRAAAVRAGGIGPLAGQVVGNWFAAGFADAHPEVLRSAVRTCTATPDEGYAACCDALATWDFTDRLGEIAVPTLVVAGRADPAAPPAAARLMADRITGARLEVLDGAAHQPSLERPAALTRLLLDHCVG